MGDGGGMLSLLLGLEDDDLEDICVVVQRGPKAVMGILNIDQLQL
jgi:hypothetical protein